MTNGDAKDKKRRERGRSFGEDEQVRRKRYQKKQEKE